MLTLDQLAVPSQVFCKKRALYQILKLNFEKNESLLNLYQKSIIMKTACKNPNKPVEDIDLIVTDLAEFFIA